MKLYAYCIAKDLDTRQGVPAGIAGATVRLLRIGNLTVPVSDCDVDVVPVTRENGLTHAAVVRAVFAQTTALPLRFGTLLTEQDLSTHVNVAASVIEQRLEHVHGCVEMNVRILRPLAIDRQPHPPEADPTGAGTAFLRQKQREILKQEQKAPATAELSWLHETVRNLIKDEEISESTAGERAMAKVAHLVELANIEPYREKIAQALKNRPELHFLVSGPWPPYSFANIELEFHRQFGVT